jgi:hypothetical protein
MDFFVMLVLLAIGGWIVLTLFDKIMPNAVKEMVGDSLRFLFKGK